MITFDFFGKRAEFDHIGLGVKSISDIDSSLDVVLDPVQKVYISFISLGGLKVELLEPYGEDSPIVNSIGKGIKFLHVCYSVDNLDKVVKDCRKYGFLCIASPVPAVAFKDRKIAWVYSNAYGLFELLEK